MPQELTEEKVVARKKWNQDYYLKRKEKILKRMKDNATPESKQRNVIKSLRWREKIRASNPEKWRLMQEKSRIRTFNKFRKNQDSWRSYIVSTTKCQICNREIKFSSGNQLNSIHFDHRNDGNEIIKTGPTVWLGKNPFNEKNKAIWDACAFGYLCKKCNYAIPTIGRKEFLHQVVRYVFGSNAFISVPTLSA